MDLAERPVIVSDSSVSCATWFSTKSTDLLMKKGSLCKNFYDKKIFFTKIISRQQRLQFGWKMILHFSGYALAEQIKPYFSAFR